MGISQSLFQPNEDIFCKIVSKNQNDISLTATHPTFQSFSQQINAGDYFPSSEIRLRILTLKPQDWTDILTKSQPLPFMPADPSSLMFRGKTWMISWRTSSNTKLSSHTMANLLMFRFSSIISISDLITPILICAIYFIVLASGAV